MCRRRWLLGPTSRTCRRRPAPGSSLQPFAKPSGEACLAPIHPREDPSPMDQSPSSEHLHIDPADLPDREAYLLLTGVVVPRPIGWISTLAADGTMNVA